MINGLSSGEAVIFKDGYLACFGRNYSSLLYEIDGVQLRTNSQVFVDSLDNIYEIVQQPARTIGRKNPETGEVVKIADIYKERNKYIDEDGEVDYPDLETHYKVEKCIEEMEHWEVVKSEEVTTKRKVDFNVVGTYEDTGSNVTHYGFEDVE